MKNTYVPIPLTTILKVEKLYSLHYFAYLKNFRFEGESHDFWELIFCDSGKVRVTDDETEFILSQGQAFIHAPRHFHNIQPEHADTNVIVIGFDGTLNALSEFAGKPIDLNQNTKQFFRIVLSESRNVFPSPLNRVYQYEIPLKSDAPPSSLQMIRTCIECILLTICLENQNGQSSENETPNAVVRQLISFLNDNTDKKLSMHSISYRFGYSSAWLQRIFRAATRKSIFQYFISLKIEKAKSYIAEGEHTVAEIADLLGYETPQYFSMQFRKITNMTPSAYAASVKETGILE